MLGRGLQILPERQEIHVGDAKVVHDLRDLGAALAESHHESALGERAGRGLLHAVEEAQRLVVAGAGPDSRVEARDGLQVVVEHVRTGLRRHLDRAGLAEEVGRQDLDRGAGRFRADGGDGGREVFRAAVGQVVPVHGGDDHVAEAERRDRTADPDRLVVVERPRVPGRDVAERARAGAGVAHDHHGGVTLRPALADVRAGSLLADGDKALLAHQAPRLLVSRAARRLDPNPVRLPQHGVVRPVRLFRVPEAMIYDEAGRSHG